MTTTHYFWDPVEDNIVQERDAAGSLEAEYTTEPSLYGKIISQARFGIESQYHFDGLGSTLTLTNEIGQITDTRAYSAFGTVTESAGSAIVPYLYVGMRGYYADAVINKYIVRRRALHSFLGRWMSKDPVVHGQSRLVYIYVTNSPLGAIDPSGFEIYEECVTDFPPDPILKKMLGVKSKCQTDFITVLFECLAETTGTKELKKCLARECGTIDWQSLLDDIISYAALLYCCDQQGSEFNDPCKCRNKGKEKAEPAKCLDPLKGDRLDSQERCQECCDFLSCVESVEELGKIARGEVNLLQKIAELRKKHPPQICYTAGCLKCE